MVLSPHKFIEVTIKHSHVDSLHSFKFRFHPIPIIVNYFKFNRDWSEIIWLPKIRTLKINLTIDFIQKTCWNALVRP